MGGNDISTALAWEEPPAGARLRMGWLKPYKVRFALLALAALVGPEILRSLYHHLVQNNFSWEDLRTNVVIGLIIYIPILLFLRIWGTSVIEVTVKGISQRFTQEERGEKPHLIPWSKIDLCEVLEERKYHWLVARNSSGNEIERYALPKDLDPQAVREAVAKCRKSHAEARELPSPEFSA